MLKKNLKNQKIWKTQKFYVIPRYKKKLEACDLCDLWYTTIISPNTRQSKPFFFNLLENDTFFFYVITFYYYFPPEQLFTL